MADGRPELTLLGGEPTQMRFGAYVVSASGIAMAVLAVLAVATGRPFLFPSLGPTAFLLFFAPMAANSSPKHVMAGHTIGVAAGVIAIVACGLWGIDGGLYEISWQRGAAAVLCVMLTVAGKLILKVPHAPALATTLIVGLGLMHQPIDLLILLGSIAIMTAVAFVVNRIAGFPYPPWHPVRDAPQVPHADQNA